MSGRVTGTEILGTNLELYEYKQQHPDTMIVYEMWNFLGAISVTISPQEMHEVALQDHAHAQASDIKKVAFVADPALAPGLFDMYEVYSEKWVGRPNNFLSRMFSTKEDAYTWLNGDSD